MRCRTARVRASHATIRVTVAIAVAACEPSLPVPAQSPRPPVDFEEVPYPPPPARVELVPDQPDEAAVWVDGEWTWNGRRWAWQYGHWVLPPRGATYSRWTTKRGADGSLFFYPAVWRNARGDVIAPPPAAVVRGGAHEGSVTRPEGETEQTAPNVVPKNLRAPGNTPPPR